MASKIIRFTIPLGTTFIFHGTVLADSIRRPNPAAVYAEPKCPAPEPGSPESAKKPKTCPKIVNRDPGTTELEKMVMQGRQSMGPYYDGMMGYVDDGLKYGNVAMEKVKDNLCYLRTRAPHEVRIGTVVAGGLTGLLLGLRGGFFRKVFMTSLGAAGGAYLAYPYESEKYSKKYSLIAYNFVTGTLPNPKSKTCESPVAKRQEEKRRQKRCPNVKDKDECGCKAG